MNEEKITNQDIINMAKDLTIPVMLSNIENLLNNEIKK